MIGWPLILSVHAGFKFVFVFLGAPVVGAIVLGAAGHLIKRIKS